MASSAAAFSANICSTNMRIRFFNKKQQKQNLNFFKIRASSEEQQDCNVEECAPDKEVGKVSVEWLAGEKTKVSGTFPPRRRDWSGYVEKDTAGQTNIYSVEPAVYVAESAISSGNSGTSADGSENTAALVAFGGLIALAAASTILLQVGKNPPPIQTLDYKGPSLTYYITKFKPSPTSIPSPETPQIDSPDVTSASPESPQIASPDATSASPESPQIDSADVASASAENLQTSQVPQIGSADVTSASAENLQASEVLQIDSADVKSTSQVQEIDPSTSPALQVEVGSD